MTVVNVVKMMDLVLVVDVVSMPNFVVVVSVVYVRFGDCFVKIKKSHGGIRRTEKRSNNLRISHFRLLAIHKTKFVDSQLQFNINIYR